MFFGIGALAVLFIFGLGGAVVSRWLVRRVWRRRASLPLVVRVLGVIAAVLIAFGALGAVVGVVTAFRAVGGENVDPAQKARILAEGIAQAMNCVSFTLLIWVPSAVVAFFVSREPKQPQ